MDRLKYFWAFSLLAFLNISTGFAINIDYQRTSFFVNCAKTVSGSGTSWDDALSTDVFIDVLSKTKKNCTFYLAEGEYRSKSSVDPSLYAAFTISYGVTIRGGYSPSQKSLDKPSGKETILCGSFPNIDYLVYANIPGEDTISFYDVHFKGSSLYSSSTCAVALYSWMTGVSPSFHFERCSFSDYLGLNLSSCKGSIIDCDFSFNSGYKMTVTGSDTREPINIISSSFMGTKCLDVYSNNTLRITNCLFSGPGGTVASDDVLSIKQVSEYISSNSENPFFSTINYNTILGNVYLQGLEYSFYGNYVHGLFSSSESLFKYYASSSNLFVVESLSDTGVSLYGCSFIEKSTVSSFFNYKSGIYEITSVKGKPTKTVRLLRDHVFVAPKMISLRNLDKYQVPDYDQTGAKRHVLACYGANECPFNDQTNYYVKTDGTGDGSSWQNAMSPLEFSFYFFCAPDKSTFHFAEGLYKYDFETWTSNILPYPCFVTRQFVNLDGGYPKKAKQGDKPDPSRYHTIFDGDIYGDSSTSVSLFVYLLAGHGDLKISGLEITNQYNHPKERLYCALTVSPSLSNVALNIEKCTFTDCACAVRTEYASLDMKDCLFDNIERVALSHESVYPMSIEACTFHKCITDAVKSNSGSVSIHNSSFIQNGSAFILSNNGSDTVANYAKIECNTILDASWISNYPIRGLSVTGNILCDNFFVDDGYKNARHNLFLLQNPPQTCYDWANSVDNIYSNYSNIDYLFDCTVDGSGSFNPVLKNDEGIKTVAPIAPLLRDTLPGGERLRFPLKYVSVNVDGRGKSRKGNTCMGAYEIGGSDQDLDIPTAFSPYSKNGKNDVFMTGHEVYIYNRYGNLLCHSDNGWDGYYRDELVEPGVYVYVVVTDSKSYKGTVEVVKSK